MKNIQKPLLYLGYRLTVHSIVQGSSGPAPGVRDGPEVQLQVQLGFSKRVCSCGKKEARTTPQVSTPLVTMETTELVY